MKDIVNINKGKIEEKNKKFNKKKVVIAILIVTFLVICGITMIIYYSNNGARKFLDQYLFRKNITQEKLNSIELNYDSNVSVFAYNKNICVIAENKLLMYNDIGNKVHEINLEINNPIYSVNNKYIAISEKNSSKINLISDSEILWTNELDGQVSTLNVNNNGYVSAVLTGTTHKSVIVTFDKEGNELFKTYLANTSVIDTTISNDNKYLAFAEVNTSGTTIQSNVKVVSIEKPSEDTIYTYTANSNKLLLNIEYSGNNKIVCMYDDEITLIQNENSNTIINLNEKGKNINFANINLENSVYKATEENDGIFNSKTVLEIKDVNSDKISMYAVDGVAKYIYSYNNIIAVCLGQGIEFINTSGWLLKSYKSTQEIQNVVIGNGVAGIVYQDRVEIINL